MVTERRNNTFGVKETLCWVTLCVELFFFGPFWSIFSDCVHLNGQRVPKKTHTGVESSFFSKTKLHHNNLSVVLNHKESVKKVRLVNYSDFIISVCVFRLIRYDN